MYNIKLIQSIRDAQTDFFPIQSNPIHGLSVLANIPYRSDTTVVKENVTNEHRYNSSLADVCSKAAQIILFAI